MGTETMRTVFPGPRSSWPVTRTRFRWTFRAAAGPGIWMRGSTGIRTATWNDPGEQIVDTQSVTAGVTTVSLTVPGDAASGDTYARFRLSTAGGLGPTGLAADGEVEDYRVTINAAPTLDAITDLTIAEDAGLQNIDLTGITAGPGETQTLHVTAISSNPLD